LPFGEINFANIGEVSMATNNKNMKKEGSQGNLSNVYSCH
jgi:hypothetical protein